MEIVSFYSQGSKLVGNLHAARGARGRAPGVVVMGSWLTVKEQMPAQYARLAAEAGLVALTFDYRGFGGSEGQPREVESARSKVEDIRNAVAFLGTRREVEPERLGVLAICASAGYTALALLEEPAIRSVAMVAPWLHDAGIVREIYGGEAGVVRRLALARSARERYVTTGEVDYVPAASNTDPSAAMYWPGDVLDYYLDARRGRVAPWGGRFAVMAWTEWLELDPIAVAGRLQVPIRIVTGEGTATPGGAKKLAAGLRAPHDVVSIPGTQFDFYDVPTTVRPAAESALEHLTRTLR